MKNRIAKNIPSPKNHDALVKAYIKLNPNGNKPNDGLDIAVVQAKNGEKGLGKMDEGLNRSRDKNFHRVQDFIPMEELQKVIKKSG